MRKIQKVLTCSDNKLRVRVTVEVEETDTELLTLEELQEASDSLVSGIMREIPAMQYLNARLINVQVR